MKVSKEQFLIEYQNGLKDSEIARKYNVSESSINVLRNSLNLPPNGRKIISDDLFFELYNSGLSDLEIAKESGASETQIRRRRDKYKLPINKKVSEAQKLLAIYFQDLYNNGKNDYEIADILKVGKTTVQKYRSTLSIPPVEKQKIDLELLEKLFNDGKTDNEIAEILGYSVHYIRAKRLSINLKRAEARVPIHHKFTEEEYQVILGSILGDGSLVQPHENGGAILTFNHCVEQEEYIRYKQNILSSIASDVKLYNKRDTRTSDLHYQQFSVYTKSIVELSEMRSHWYTPIKRVYYEDVKNLSPLGLAIWYMDDGFKNKPYGGCTLCTNCFSKEDLEVLKKVLKDNFNISATSNQARNVLYIPSNEFSKFKEIVEPFIVPCLKYKVSS